MIPGQMTERSLGCSKVQIVIIELCHAGAEPEVIRLVICDGGGCLECWWVLRCFLNYKRHQKTSARGTESSDFRQNLVLPFSPVIFSITPLRYLLLPD